MRRGAFLVLIAVLALAAAACGGSGGADREAQPAGPAAAEAPAGETAPEAPAAETAPAETAAGPVECVEEEFADQGRDHVEELPAGFEYNSFPPTSGPHAPSPVRWNLYGNPVSQLSLVHNLEHGGIVVQIGIEVPQEVFSPIINWYLESPNAIVLAPYPELGDKVALTAWRHLLTCDGFDEERYTAFRDAYRFKGPERIAPAFTAPGQ